jgi:hypothetical protein
LAAKHISDYQDTPNRLTLLLLLQDQRLAFKLKRQQFIELLRKGDAAGDVAALGMDSSASHPWP